MRALITGGRGGLGRAFADALGEDTDVTLLDLPEFDVADPALWRALDGPYDAAFLNGLAWKDWRKAGPYRNLDQYGEERRGRFPRRSGPRGPGAAGEG